MSFDPEEWDDLEVDDVDDDSDEVEEDFPETEAQLMESVKVSDEEVDEFLSDFNAKPILAREPGTVPVDPFEKDASRELDTFKEVRSRKTLEHYGRGMAHNQMVITLRDRIHMLQEHAAGPGDSDSTLSAVSLWLKCLERMEDPRDSLEEALERFQDALSGHFSHVFHDFPCVSGARAPGGGLQGGR